jgi:hypothetical protein
MEKLKEKPAANPQLITDDLEIIGIFKAFMQRKEKLWTWQTAATGKSRRVVHYSIVKRVDPLKKTIELKPNNRSGFHFTSSDEIFLFSKVRSIAIKLKVREMGPEFIVLVLPVKLNTIHGDFLKNIELVEKENEDAHKHMRTVPRVVALEEQLVGIRRKTDSESQYQPLEFYGLHDMSQGGLSFHVSDPAEFTVGDTVQVEHLNAKELKTALAGKVASVRLLEDNEELFKVGVAFLKG